MHSPANNITFAEAGEAVTLTIHGNILSTNVQDVRQRVLDALAGVEERNQGWAQLELDLRAAQMIDSTGLNFLVALVRHVKKRGVAIRIKVASANIQKSFSFIRLDRQAEVVLVADDHVGSI